MVISDFRDVSPYIFDLLTSESVKDLVLAKEDIVTHAGEVVVSSGEPITLSLRPKLLNKKLSKPLETSIESKHVITPVDFYNEALSLLEEHAHLKEIFWGVEIEALALVKVDIDPLPAMLISLSRLKDKKVLRHTVLLTLVARMIARKLRFDESEMLKLTQAAGAHDIGEFYLGSNKEGSLTSEDWKTVMAHPKVGSMLVKYHTGYSTEVARAIYEHHERSDGSGYPRKLVSSQISRLGNVLIVSELLAGMLLKPGSPMHHALLVTRFMPSEFPTNVMNAVHRYVTEKVVIQQEAANDQVNLVSIKEVINEFNDAEQHVIQLQKRQSSLIESEVIEEAHDKIVKLRRATASLGLDSCLDLTSWEDMKDDPAVRLELDVAVREIAWRLRDIARDMVLNLADSATEASAELGVFIEKMARINLTKQKAV